MQVRAVLRGPSSGATAATATVKSADRRVAERRSLILAAQTTSPSAGDLQVVILDISKGGLLAQAESSSVSVGDQVAIELPEQGVVRTRVVWVSGSFFGCQFTQVIAPATISAALLKADAKATPQRPLVSRQERYPSKGLQPELNLSAVFLLAVCGWILIGIAVYFLS